MTETAFLSAIIIAQFTVLAGMIMYIAQRLERRMDRLEDRMDRMEARLEARMDRLDERMDRLEERMDRLEERLRVVELQVALLIGRMPGDDPKTYEDLRSSTDLPSAEATAAAR
jgi:predicted nuclease with TOPRIM domain